MLMQTSTALPRKSKYCMVIEEVLQAMGHGTNQEIHDAMCQIYPTVSLTTIHRLTARLASRGLIGVGPVAPDGSIRYDANRSPHDHFMCDKCGGIRDVELAETMRPILQKALGGCRVSGNITVHGSCENCYVKK